MQSITKKNPQETHMSSTKKARRQAKEEAQLQEKFFATQLLNLTIAGAVIGFVRQVLDVPNHLEDYVGETCHWSISDQRTLESSSRSSPKIAPMKGSQNTGSGSRVTDNR